MIRMTYAFLPLLADQNDAVVMNVASALAFVPFPSTPTYSATKAALHSFSESLRIRLADAGVQVIEVVPPGVRTTLMGQQDNEHAMPWTTSSPRPSTSCATSPTPRRSSSSAPGSSATPRPPALRRRPGHDQRLKGRGAAAKKKKKKKKKRGTLDDQLG